MSLKCFIFIGLTFNHIWFYLLWKIVYSWQHLAMSCFDTHLLMYYVSNHQLRQLYIEIFHWICCKFSIIFHWWCNKKINNFMWKLFDPLKRLIVLSSCDVDLLNITPNGVAPFGIAPLEVTKIVVNPRAYESIVTPIA